MNGLQLINLMLLGGSLLAGQAGHLPLALSLSVTGIATSGYLTSKTPNKNDSLVEAREKLSELESTIVKLTTETSWQQQLLTSTDDRLNAALLAKSDEYQKQLQAIYKTQEDALKSKDGEIHQERVKASQVVSQWEAKLVNIQQDYEVQISAVKDELKGTIEWREATLKLEKDLKSLQEELKLKQKSLALEEKRIRLDIRDERGVTKKLLEDTQLELKSLSMINERLKHQIIELKTQNEQLYNDLYAPKSDKPEDELLTTIQAALGQHGIQTEFKSRRINDNVETFILKPTTYFEPTKLTIVAEILPGLIDVPQPRIEAKKGHLEVRIDRRDELDRIKDAPENWLEILYKDAAKDGKNLALLGARGKGKTELAKNYCGLVIKGEPDAEILYIQPKVDDYAEFTIAGKVFSPDYVGFEPITSNRGLTIPSAYDGILYLKQLYDERNKANQQAFANDEPSPKFNRVFFLIDELQLLVSREKEFIDPDVLKSEKLRLGQTFCGKIVRDAISIGRSLGIVVLALGQLPNVSVYGWNKNDLYQYIVIFMSANISEAANSYAPTKEEKGRILGELELWRKRASVDSSKDYYCYVRPMDKSGYLALLPAPGTYLS